MAEHRFLARVCALALSVAGCTAGTITERSIQGQLVRGPQLDSRAYAHATMASVFEASNRPAEALKQYQSALTFAPANASLLARVGNLQCLDALAPATNTLAEAERLAPAYQQTQIYHALCLERHGQLAAATARAEQAVGLMPSSAEANHLWTKLLLRGGHTQAAERVRIGFQLMYPDAAEAKHGSPPIDDGRYLLLSDWSAKEEAEASSSGSAQGATCEEKARRALASGDGRRAKILLERLANSSPQDEDRQRFAMETALLLQDWNWANQLLRKNRVSRLQFTENAEAHRQLLDEWVGHAAGAAFLRAYRQRDKVGPSKTSSP